MPQGIFQKTIKRILFGTDKKIKIVKGKKAKSILMDVWNIHNMYTHPDNDPNCPSKVKTYFTIADNATAKIPVTIDPPNADVNLEFSCALSSNDHTSTCFKLMKDGTITGIYTGYYDYVRVTDLNTGLTDTKKVFVPVKRAKIDDMPFYITIGGTPYSQRDHQIILNVNTDFEEFKKYIKFDGTGKYVYKIQILKIVKYDSSDVKLSDVHVKLLPYQNSLDKLEFTIVGENPKNKVQKLRVKVSHIYNDLLSDDFWLVSEMKGYDEHGLKRTWHIERNNAQ